jgi:hypothetical protein
MVDFSKFVKSRDRLELPEVEIMDKSRIRDSRPAQQQKPRKGAANVGQPPRIPAKVTERIYTCQYGQAVAPWSDPLKPYLIYSVTYSDAAVGDEAYYPWLAPDWWLIAGYKRWSGDTDPRYAKYERVSEEGFRDLYSELLNRRYLATPQRFWDIIAVDYPIVLQCYCKPGKFCHRHLTRDFLIAMAASKGHKIENGGELVDAIGGTK